MVVELQKCDVEGSEEGAAAEDELVKASSGPH